MEFKISIYRKEENNFPKKSKDISVETKKGVQVQNQARSVFYGFLPNL